MSTYPQRIVCLSTETVDVLYSLGEEDRIVGISGFTVRPERARREKPKVSGFSSGNLERILAVEPDLVLGFSDLQTEMLSGVARAGIEIHLFNQRSIAGILRMIATLGRLVSAHEQAEQLIATLQSHINAAQEHAKTLPHRPKVYFEEWNEPLITGVHWVSELIHLAGGDDIFADRATAPNARGRTATPEEVIQRNPDIIVGSWCGKHFQSTSVTAREGWDEISAIKHGHLHEIKSPKILSPGPVAILEGLPEICAIVQAWATQRQRST